MGKVNCDIFLPGTRVIYEVPHMPEVRLHTFIRGCKEDHYIILDYPFLPKGVTLVFKEMMPCILRFLSQGKVFGFKSEIKSVSKYPYPFLFINYPKELDCINLRGDLRIPLRLPVVYSKNPLTSDDIGQPNGYFLDLSERGFLLEAMEQLEINEDYYLSFELPDQELVVNLFAKIKRTARKEHSYHHGGVFLDTESEAIARVRKYLSYLKKLQLQTS